MVVRLFLQLAVKDLQVTTLHYLGCPLLATGLINTESNFKVRLLSDTGKTFTKHCAVFKRHSSTMRSSVSCVAGC